MPRRNWCEARIGQPGVNLHRLSEGASPHEGVLPQEQERPSARAVAGWKRPGRAVRAQPSRFCALASLSYARREAMELRRDPIRLTLALFGTVLLMLILGYGISMDVEDLSVCGA